MADEDFKALFALTPKRVRLSLDTMEWFPSTFDEQSTSMRMVKVGALPEIEGSLEAACCAAGRYNLFIAFRDGDTYLGEEIKNG